MMTKAELLEKLKTLPEDAEILVYDAEWGTYDQVTQVRIKDDTAIVVGLVSPDSWDE